MDARAKQTDRISRNRYEQGNQTRMTLPQSVTTICKTFTYDIMADDLTGAIQLRLPIYWNEFCTQEHWSKTTSEALRQLAVDLEVAIKETKPND